MSHKHRSPRTRQTATHLGAPSNIIVESCDVNVERENDISVTANVRDKTKEPKNYMAVVKIGGNVIGERDMITGVEGQVDEIFTFEPDVQFEDGDEVVIEFRTPDGSSVIDTHKCGKLGSDFPVGLLLGTAAVGAAIIASKRGEYR